MIFYSGAYMENISIRLIWKNGSNEIRSCQVLDKPSNKKAYHITRISLSKPLHAHTYSLAHQSAHLLCRRDDIVRNRVLRLAVPSSSRDVRWGQHEGHRREESGVARSKRIHVSLQQPVSLEICVVGPYFSGSYMRTSCGTSCDISGKVHA